MRIINNNNTSTTEQQSSSGDDSSVHRKSTNHFKSVGYDKNFGNDKFEENESFKVKAINIMTPEGGETSVPDSKKDIEVENVKPADNIHIEKNELFTFMTSDNCNASQRVRFP